MPCIAGIIKHYNQFDLRLIRYVRGCAVHVFINVFKINSTLFIGLHIMANCANAIALSAKRKFFRFQLSLSFSNILEFFASPGCNPFLHVILSGETKN